MKKIIIPFIVNVMKGLIIPFIVFMILYLSPLHCFHKSPNYPEVSFYQLPKVVQDSLQNLMFYVQNTKNKLSLPSLLDFTNNNYTLEVKLWHNYIDKIILKNKNSNKKYYFYENEGTPFIIYENILYIPVDYNVLYSDVDSTLMFKKVELKK